ncbi:unnamed protein product [Notodromas monacha]|uniref:RING-type E3 ubiquitin transferase n=1 Tax=Notodromas monacha TaxID=399045 RepID=A0A7R9BKF4_9CRUS|nr:unnamed protein product [Notodromas monacha]CAG0917125.1 unnamed protein product [Notodromas monacha]
MQTKMRALLFALGSFLLTSAVVGHAYYQRKQFYPSVVFITKSNPSMAVMYTQGFVLVLLVGKLMRKLFFGQLHAAEFEHLIERSWYAVTETCLAFTVFRDDFSPKFVALFTLLLFLKSFHWLAEDRVDFMERSPVITWVFHLRILCKILVQKFLRKIHLIPRVILSALLTLLGALDYLFVNSAYHSTLSKGPSVQLVFGFEYAILLTITTNISIKYILHTIDIESENPWEAKAVYLLHTELIVGFLKVVLYGLFMLIMARIHTFPLFAIRPMYLTTRAFKRALQDVIMSRRAIRNMNHLYPDVTPEELANSDSTCIICREEMTSGAKRLPCNHIFHTLCLRSWFQRQQTCPTCRLDVLQTAQPQAPPRPPPPAANNAQADARPAPPPAQPMGHRPFHMPHVWMPAAPRQGNAGDASSDSTAGASASSSSTQAGPIPMMPPPFAFSFPAHGFPFPPPPPFFPPPPISVPLPPANFEGMTREELEALVGVEEENIRNRIRCLRNIQCFLDAAVLQMHQYSTATGRHIFTSNDEPTLPNFEGLLKNLQEEARKVDKEPEGAAGFSPPQAPEEIPEEDKEAAELRKLRLQRFSPNDDSAK